MIANIMFFHFMYLIKYFFFLSNLFWGLEKDHFDFVDVGG